MIYRTIIFDFDGTIADTMEEGRRIFNEIGPAYGIRQIDREEMEGFRSYTINQFIEEMKIPKTKIPFFIAKGTLAMRRSIAGLPLIAGVGEVLPALRARVDRFGILTSNAVDNVELFLDSHGIRGLFDFVSSTSKLTGKSRHLNATRKQYGLKTEEMLYVGDEVRDLQAAKKAGIPCAGVTWGFNTRERLAAEHPDHLLDNPAEFLALAGH
ncbi:HAD hydrolase-like protein [Luteolibacter sp. SL250]|uniref:HAD hydrolase-like protein n=1 Tax=Luteolibacter sp. SL250 TaxID=2995170 RepID=UPI002271218F|nr:HAD hydrolase-like protein [Luteolibacter sp. SL250]WAC21647.1 HAD hydrolase-like protein [Luteolibacter sp. SL250]